MLDTLYGVNHADILAHLEGGLCDGKFHEFEALLAQGLKEELRIPLTGLCYLDT
jgi:hypothetical protein